MRLLAARKHSFGARLGLALLWPSIGCSAPPQPGAAADECSAVVWGTPRRASERLSVLGSWDDWSTPIAMRDFSQGEGPGQWQVAELRLTPGVYGYVVIEEGKGHVDPYNPLTSFRDPEGLEVSRLQVLDCQQPRLQVQRVDEDAPDGFAIELAFTAARDGAPVDPATVSARLADGTPLLLEAVGEADEAEQILRLRATGLPRGKHRVEVEALDERGRATEPVTGVGWVQPVASTWDDGIVYQIMIDRYRGDAGAALAPPPDAGARAGGTLDGVISELRAGTFESLGVSTLWLSPVYLNPVEAREGRDDDRLYEGYHGYWVLDSRAVDPRIGGEAALHELVELAHARGIRVLLDLVPNHLYEANPRVAQNRDRSWFHEHEPECICGSPTCPWGAFIEVCWFTDYLPDLRFEQPEVMELAVEDARWWHETFDTDGFRIDAVPMMPRAVTRRIAHALRQDTGPRDAAFTIGEIFTGPGAGGTEIIRYHLGPDGIDSAFDFPLMWVMRDALAHGTADLSAVEASLANTDRALDGSGARLGVMIGNHDVTRFSSEASGNAAGDPWDDPPAIPVDDEVYERTGLALGLVLTLPGLPVLYYGDELGLAGGADPDNRRVMPVADDLLPAQVQLQERTRALARLRRCLPALRRGDRRALVTGRDEYAFVRDAGDGAPAIVVLQRSALSVTVELPANSTPAPGWYKDAVSGQRFEIGPEGAAVPMEPRSLRVLVPESSPCGSP